MFLYYRGDRLLKKILHRIRKTKYPNRFVKFYQLNKKRINKDRRSLYDKKQDKGTCVRCKKKALKNIVFCRYHQQKQKEYNKKARSK